MHYNVARIHLYYDTIHDNDPNSIIIKMIYDKNDNSILRKFQILLKKKFSWLPIHSKIEDFIEKLNSYEIELEFYSEFAKNLPIPTPKCYYHYKDYFNFYFLLILEDLGSYDVGQPDGFCNEASFEIIKNVSKLHAKYWGDSTIENRPSKLVQEYGGYWFGSKEMDHSKSLYTVCLLSFCLHMLGKNITKLGLSL
jgi:hypothetical protein